MEQAKVDANDVLTEYKQRVSDLEFQNIVLNLQVKKLQEQAQSNDDETEETENK